MPQKDMRQHRHQQMVVPARVLAHFIVVHAAFGFAVCKTLLNGPPQTTSPHAGA
jgi:hypothetical protein